ncbi:uncharacterized protein PHALS_05709 [Plasmopara halstedii]|uniref:Uncharacterized protein n=1 Tax=Plasmopara halstedii TaxID=4781 RepID=A0A0P1B0M9_PLAHL|nr:uncharacterized protein PHALS_05709 [Plasmopara halstedii]CEG48240.1 hypothetical protein PHALS_05709 [Plasmopara halstedii]|eukprot:XP_024584609.1 hypothetical protein PHALS_05709 [Plasmopara halstedii]
MLRSFRLIRSAENCQVVLRHISYGSAAPHSGENSSFLSLLTLAGAMGGVAYVYYDPDVLPTGVKRWLAIQEPEGRSMSLEEYEHWRAQQAGSLAAMTQSHKDKGELVLKQTEQTENIEPPTMDDNLLIPYKDVSPFEMKLSLEKLLAEARDNEAAFIADINSNRVTVPEEQRQMLQAFKDEKTRLKKQLKFLKSNK